MTQRNFSPADFSIPSSIETQNSESDGVGNAASSPTHGSHFGTIAPPQLSDPTHPRLSGNYDNPLRNRLHSGTDVRPPHRLWPPNTSTPLAFTLTDSSHALSFLENPLIAPPSASTNDYPETSSYGHLTYPTHRGLAPNEQIDDLYNGTGVPHLQTAMQQSAPVLPSIAHGFWKRFVDALPWLMTGTERDGVAHIERITHQFGLQNHTAHAPPPVSRVVPQPFQNSSTTHPAPTLPELSGAGIGHSSEIPRPVGMSSAQMNNPYPVNIAAEQPQRSPGPSTTHPTTTTRSEFGGNWPSSPLSESSATSPHGNRGLQPPSSSPHFNHGVTPTFSCSTSPLSRMLMEPTPPANITPTLPAIPYCEPWHELQPFKREHETNPSPSTQGAFGSGAPSGAYHAAGHGQYPAVPAAANTVPMASIKRRASIKIRKPGNCSRCPLTFSSQWRTDPDTGSPLCNACGQKARSKKRKQEQELNAHAG
ncbi:hypothetical protein B0H13DRAFT_47043 [Mycena leptocephala]|nr:hypothetical protein B0H13DRAFT_47043 [Mycena leptocephala]